MTSVLDTRSVPPAERREYWSAGIAERFFPMEVESVGAPSFEARLAGGQIGPVGVQSIQGLAHRVARTQRMIAIADPECILLYLMTRGAIHIEQDERSCALRPGDIACQDTSRPSTFEGREGFEVLVFSIPKWFIGAQADGIARRSATLVDSGQGRLAGPAIPFLAQLARTTTSGGGFSGRDGEGAAEMMLPLASQHVRRAGDFRSALPPRGTARADAAVRDGPPARPGTRTRVDRPGPLRVHALRAQDLCLLRHRGVVLDPRTPVRGCRGRIAAVPGNDDRDGRDEVGIPPSGELQQGLPRGPRMCPARRQAAAGAGG